MSQLKPIPDLYWNRLLSHLAYVGDCWIWVGNVNPAGYGQMRVKQDGEFFTASTHRLTYAQLRGFVPEGLQLDHLCRFRACCNPDHLEPVTCRENLLRGETRAAANAAKEFCVHGHKFEGYNVAIDEKGHRKCRTCAREKRAAWRRARGMPTGPNQHDPITGQFLKREVAA